MSRPPLDLTPARPVPTEELSLARSLIERSGVLGVLIPHVEEDTGRPRKLSLEGLLVAFQLNAVQRRHQAHLVQAARVLNALSEDQRALLGIKNWDPDEAYECVVRLYRKVCRVLADESAGVDVSWFLNRFARAAVPEELLSSRAVAVDGTDVESWGRLKATSRIDLDGEATDTQVVNDDLVPPPDRRRTTAKVFGIGPDGRNIYTKDPDARAGHRSATGQRSSGPYVGYELHLAVPVRDVRWTNFIDQTSFGEEVPGVITTCALVSAGSHRGKSIVQNLIESSGDFHEIEEVVWDPGYSLCQPETTTYPLVLAGIEQTLQPVTHQRGIRPFSGEALLLDGQLYSRYLPAELRDLAMPPRRAPSQLRRAYEEPFNRRARWRYVRHSRPDTDGVTRWKCPFCAGLLRTRRFPETMRRTRRAPLVTLPPDVGCCCEGTLSAPPVELPLAQKIPFGTTAWRKAMDRRQVVEGANSGLKGGFTDISRGFVRVFGLVKVGFLFSFTIAAYNADRVRSFLAKRAERRKSTRRKRRLGVFGELFSCPANLREQSTGPPG